MLAESEDRVADAFENAGGVIDEALEKFRLAGAGPEEGPGVADGLGAAFDQQLHEAMADDGVVTDAIVGAHVGGPELREAQRLGPEAKRVVGIVLENDAPTGADSADHFADHGGRVGDMFEEEAGVSNIKRAVFVGCEGELIGGALAEIDEDCFAGCLG